MINSHIKGIVPWESTEEEKGTFFFFRVYNSGPRCQPHTNTRK